MSIESDPFETIENIRFRTTEAIIAQSRTRSRALQAYLREALVSVSPAAGALIRESIIEAAHPFEAAEKTMEQLSGNLLVPSLVSALDGGDKAGSKSRKYCFKKEWYPHRHQLTAWQLLDRKTAESVLVTSGTGSGKTECFLVPLLNDLARQAEQASAALSGVQAIALYPLNALIASQRERLSEWTAPFGGKIRFGLFNGLMPEDLDGWQEKQNPEEVLSRRVMRANPPPILVTNVTMLEYMLVRAKDRPIIERSKGKLRWIILDEAHTHVGAAAAEITLLIRRVLEAFEVAPSDVRFVATSATIGSGPDVIRDLKRYLCEVSGAPEDRVHVVEGKRRAPHLPALTSQSGPLDLTECYNAKDVNEALFDKLAPRSEVQKLVTRLAKQEAITKSEFDNTAQALGLSSPNFANALSSAQKGIHALAPLRIHNFHRVMPGLWSCVNSKCPDKPDSWRFGKVFHQQAESCSTCSSPVLEIVGCNQCGEAMLEADEVTGHLVQRGNPAPLDEFSEDPQNEKIAVSDGDEENEGEDPAASKLNTHVNQSYLFTESQNSEGATRLFIGQTTRRVYDGPIGTEEAVIQLIGHYRCHVGSSGSSTCPSCFAESNSTSGEIIRPFRFGAPLILSNATPALLEGVEPAKPDPSAVAPPGEGRRLLSFTDSRQGTARFAAKLETDAERAFIRAYVYQAVQNAARLTDEERKDITKSIKDLETALSASPSLESTLMPLILEKRAKLEEGGQVTYQTLSNQLSNEADVAEWILRIWQTRDPDTFKNSTAMADFLLMRELYRRPKRANSIETLGLGQLIYPAIERVSDVPKHLSSRGANLADWKDLLSIILTHWARTQLAVSIDKQQMHWTAPNQFPKWLVGPDEFPANKAQVRWPMLAKGQYGAIPALISVGLGLKHDDPIDIEIVNEILAEAWKKLRSSISSPTGSYVVDIRGILLGPITKAWQCSETGRVLDRCFRGISPYAARPIMLGHIDARCSRPLILPKHPAPFPRTTEAKQEVEHWLKTDPLILEARTRSIWTNLTDRSARFPIYFRSEEHSAQQPPLRLREYEKDFTAGRLNVLNCSTTMEMGVDIGEVSSVMMTNVPPSIASYRQRVGRAGRRGQAIATAFTLCKDRPLDREVFAEPIRFMQRQLAAPRVALDSRTIVQRHVNAWLLAAYVNEVDGETYGAKAGSFFGFRSNGERIDASVEAPSVGFAQCLSKSTFKENHIASIENILRGSILEKDYTVFDATKAHITSIEADFERQVLLLRGQMGARDAADRSVEIQLKRLCDDFLLGHLADAGFLPGHGFPTDVVQFVVPSEKRRQSEDAKRRGNERENRFETQSFPSRSLDIAIREFAPGADIVLDGLVHRSGGVSLNWKRPASDEEVREIQSLPWIWRCRSCGATDTAMLMPNSTCPACGEDGLERHQALKPAGFVADWRAQAHTQIEEVSYVPAEPVGVSLHESQWTSLIDPGFGRIRASRETRILHKSAGSHKYGYAICLECGRSEPEKDMGGENPLEGHAPLRGHSGDGKNCLGNSKPFAIRRNHWLLHTFTTDGVELELEGLGSLEGARALASALREALARSLGIEPDEMGLEAAQHFGEMRQARKSLFLFDRASGGGGFSVQLPMRLMSIWDEVEAILDCSTPGCVTGCSNCVVNRDVGDRDTPVDRQAALDWLKTWRAKYASPQGIDQITPVARFCDAILDAIDSEIGLHGAANALVQLAIPINAERELDDGNFSGRLAHWSRLGARVELILDQAETLEADHAAKRRIWTLAIRCHATLTTADLMDCFNSHKPLGRLTIQRAQDGKVHIGWFSRDRNTIGVSSRYGRPHEAPIIETPVQSILQTTAIEEDRWLTALSGEKLCEVGREFDGTFEQFGRVFANTLVQEFTKLGIWPKSEISVIKYRDRYCTSPLTVRLLLELIKRLAEKTKTDLAAIRASLEVRGPKPGETRGYGRIHNDWPTSHLLITVPQLAAEAMGVELNVILQPNPPHARRMEITFADGKTLFIILDQGFGPWNTNLPVQFDHQNDASAQAKRLLSINALIHNAQHFGTHFFLGAKE